MAWFWIALSLIIFFYLLTHLLSPKLKLPPSPIGLPIIGHLHLLGKKLHHDLHRLSRKHGPIMHLRLGCVPAVVVSSPAGAELVLKMHDLVLAGRTHHQTAKHLGYDGRNIVFSPYGPYWRNMRKLCTVELLSGFRINQFQPMRRAELGSFTSSLRQSADEREVVDVSARVSTLIGDMTCLMVFGRKYVDRDLDEKGFKAVVDEALQGLNRRMKELSKTFDGFLERIIDDQELDGNKTQKLVKDVGGLHGRVSVSSLGSLQS